MESIAVKNYRSINDSKEIVIKPLNIILGKNSAGKSSFVRLFPLMKQTIERKTSEPLLWYGDYVDFGDFKNTVSRQNSDAPIEISFAIKMSKGFIEYFSGEKKKEKFIARIELSINEKCIEKVKISFHDQNLILTMDNNNIVSVLINGNEILNSNQNIKVSRENGDLIPKPLMFILKDNELSGLSFVEGKKLRLYKKLYNKKPNKIITGLYDFRNYYIGPEMNNPFLSKEELLNVLKSIDQKKFGKYRIEFKRFESINNDLLAINIGAIISRINTAIEFDLNELSYLKPIRAMVNRYYRVQGISIDELDSDGGNLPMILKNMTSKQLESFEKWTKEKFGVVFSVMQYEGHVSLVVKSGVNQDVITNVADTGYGYSQILPIILLLWKVHNKEFVGPVSEKTIVIEQPELHLHPAYQAKIMDLFVQIINESENAGLNIKIILETHSETIVNRIGKLVSEKRINNQKVNILIFDKDKDETVITSRSFSEDGLISNWPIGFFATEGD